MNVRIASGLEDEFERELNLAFRNGGPHQRSRDAVRTPISSKDVGIAITGSRGPKVGMIDNVEHFDPELDIEILRDSPDVIVLEHGEVETGDSGTDHDIATGVAAEVEARQRREAAPRIVRIGDRPEIRRIWGAVRIPECQIRRGGNRKALGLDVIFRMAGICQAAAPGAAQAIWISEIVATIGVCGVSTGPVSGREGDTVAEG